MNQRALSKPGGFRYLAFCAAAHSLRQYTSTFAAGFPARPRRKPLCRVVTGSPKPACTMQELPETATTTPDIKNKKHIIVMANGLFGTSSNWDVVVEDLEKQLDISQTLLVASDANSLTQVAPTIILPCVEENCWLHSNHMCLQTYDGIDTCGDRLALEIQSKVEEYPSLEKISLLGHSMGGLLVRFAAGGY